MDVDRFLLLTTSDLLSPCMVAKHRNTLLVKPSLASVELIACFCNNCSISADTIFFSSFEKMKAGRNLLERGLLIRWNGIFVVLNSFQDPRVL